MVWKKQVGNYAVLEELETTAYAKTLRAATLEAGRVKDYYLLDLIHPDLAANPNFKAQYQHQDPAIAQMVHQHILPRKSLVENDGQLAAVYDFFEGCSLQRVFERCDERMNPLPIGHALWIANRICDGLVFAASKGIHHGHINPSVVLIGYDGSLKLKGFGLSRAAAQLPGGIARLIPALKAYSLEESQAGQVNAQASDIFGIGSLLFHMLTGHTLEARQPADITKALRTAKYAEDDAPLSSAVAAAIFKCTALGQPTAFQNLPEVASALQGVQVLGQSEANAFELAFFMDDAFRSEIEELTAAIASETEDNLNEAKVAAAPAAASVTPPKPIPEATPKVVASKPEEKSKKRVWLALGGVAAAVAAAMIWLFVLKPGGDEKSKFEREMEELLVDVERQKEAEIAQAAEYLSRENEIIKELVAQREKERAEREARKKLEEEKARLEEQARQQAQDNQQREVEKLRAQAEEVERQRAALLEAEKKRQELIASLEQEKKELLEEDKPQETREMSAANEVAGVQANGAHAPEQAQGLAVPQGQPATQTLADNGSASSLANDGAIPQSAPSLAANNVPPPERSAPSRTPLKPAAEARISQPAVMTPPSAGDLVPANDEYLEKPSLNGKQRPYTWDLPERFLDLHEGRSFRFVLNLLVNEKGRVEKVEISQNPFTKGENDFGLSKQVARAAKRLRFKPGKKMGVKVKTWHPFSLKLKF